MEGLAGMQAHLYILRSRGIATMRTVFQWYQCIGLREIGGQAPGGNVIGYNLKVLCPAHPTLIVSMYMYHLSFIVVTCGQILSAHK